MPWEFEEEEVKPRRDWARLMWYGVAVLMIIGIGMMFMPQNKDAESTRARVSHLLIKADSQDAAAAKAAYEKITAIQKEVTPGNFASEAAKYSEDSLSAPKGGDLGWVHRGELADAIETYIWGAPLNQVSPIIQTDYGFHLVIVHDRVVSKAEQYELELKQRVLKQGGSPETAPKP